MKFKTIYICSQCSYETGKWLGRCPSCGEYNSFIEDVESPEAEALVKGTAFATAKHLKDVNAADAPRLSVGIAELDRVLGGGMVPASVVLTCGDPGIGKSTLLLQAAHKLAGHGTVLYVSAEESPFQVKMRADRLGINADELYILAENNIEGVLVSIDSLKPVAVIVDSIQTVFSPSIPSAAGSVSQVRECAAKLMQKAKTGGTAMFLVGHVTKEGAIAGPKVLEHMVDTVLYFEGERSNTYRILRAVKNRFGSTNEIGIFVMRDNGLAEVANPSELLLTQREQPVSGAAIACTMEGTRPVLVEIQALVGATAYGTPRRVCAGFDYNRLAMIMAVLEKRVGLPVGALDSYVNVAGGLKLDEPAADLAVACAIASSSRNRPIPEGTAIIGEVGLTGEVRPVGRMAARVAECSKLGYKRVIAAKSAMRGIKSDIKVAAVETVAQAIVAALGNEG